VLWYGTPNVQKLKNILTTERVNAQSKRLHPRRHKKRADFFFCVNVPLTFNFVVFLTVNNVPLVYCFSNFYFLCIALNKSNADVRTSRALSGLVLNGDAQTNSQVPFFKLINLVVMTAVSFFFRKIKFKGKGYYVYKNFRNAIAFKFGYSHRIRVYANEIYFKTLSKTALLAFGFTQKNVVTQAKQFKDTRPINIFTNKGVRFTRQVIYRKVGKVGSYR
jgi:hypothetical protein